MASRSSSGFGAGLSAATDLGLGGQLADQVKGETEEEKRKRMLGLSVTQSPAAQMLLGNGMSGGR